MKNKRLYWVLVAGIVILVAVLVYAAVDLIPSVSDFSMATDATGENQTTVFSPTDHVYALFEVHGIRRGTKFQSRWYALTLEGHDPKIPFQAIEYSAKENAGKLYFELQPIMNLPVGSYKVEIYMNNKKVSEQTFSVR